jgi:hypothetical protein
MSRPGICHSYNWVGVGAKHLTRERHQHELAILEGDQPPALGGEGRENHEVAAVLEDIGVVGGVRLECVLARDRDLSSLIVGFAATAGLATARLRRPATMDSVNLIAFRAVVSREEKELAGRWAPKVPPDIMRPSPAYPGSTRTALDLRPSYFGDSTCPLPIWL